MTGSPQMLRAIALEQKLRDLTGLQKADVLSMYRSWLDRHAIPAEGTDGWPTEDAYDDANVQRWGREMTEEP
jgi:hypothetical protein